MKAVAVGLLSAALVLASSTSAWAQATGAAAAEALFDEGRSLVAAGKFKEGCAKLEASHQIDPALGTKLHLGDCYERSGRTASAWAMFREAASIATVRREEQRAEVARTRAQALEPKLAKLSLDVAAGKEIEGLEVKIDGVAIPPQSWGTALPVDPGKRVLTATAPGYKPWSKELAIAVGPSKQSAEVPVLVAEPKKPEPESSGGSVRFDSSDASDPDGSTQRMVGLITAGVGAAGLVAGGVLGLTAKNKNDDSKEFCPVSDTECTSEGVELREDAKTFARASNIAFGAGLVLGVTGAVLYFTAPKRRERAATSRFVVAPEVAPTRAGLGFGGVW